MASDPSSEETHLILNCKEFQKVFHKYHGFKKQLHYGEEHRPICYFCHVPQCNDQLHRTFIPGSTDACDFPDIIVPVVYFILGVDTLQKEAAQAFGHDWRDTDAII